MDEAWPDEKSWQDVGPAKGASLASAPKGKTAPTKGKGFLSRPKGKGDGIEIPNSPGDRNESGGKGRARVRRETRPEGKVGVSSHYLDKVFFSDLLCPTTY